LPQRRGEIAACFRVVHAGAPPAVRARTPWHASTPPGPPKRRNSGRLCHRSLRNRRIDASFDRLPAGLGGQAGIDVVRPLEGDGMNELSTQELLKRIEHGDTGAIEALLPRVYAELRAAAAGLMAHERGSHTLRPTELVHEAYLKMAGGGLCEVADRRHFVAIASRAMRQILVDHARTRGALKRGGEAERVSMEIAEESQGSSGWRELDVLQLDGALTRLEVKDRLQAEIVQLRVFGGLTNDETAMAIGVSPRWAAELWRFAKAWLRREISDRGGLDLGHAGTAGT
jgi:RNA polymerase sigma-70 factor, ECF subfamily